MPTPQNNMDPTCKPSRIHITNTMCFIILELLARYNLYQYRTKLILWLHHTPYDEPFRHHLESLATQNRFLSQGQIQQIGSEKFRSQLPTIDPCDLPSWHTDVNLHPPALATL